MGREFLALEARWLLSEVPGKSVSNALSGGELGSRGDFELEERFALYLVGVCTIVPQSTDSCSQEVPGTLE